jgi:hypothetical protein
VAQVTKQWREAWERANHLASVARHFTEGGPEQAVECLDLGRAMRESCQADYFVSSCEWTAIAASLALDGAPIEALP